MKMTKLFAPAAALLLAAPAAAQTNWKVDASHSKLRFSVSHMMVSETEGKFKVFDGNAKSKSDLDFTNADISFTADPNSVDTDDPKRDGHLRGADFFDVEKFPQMTFKSISMKPTGKGKTSYDL
jgi:polyisoprenoid-binding protein YceI